MKDFVCVLTIELWAWDSDPSDDGANSDSIVISRSLRLPFLPCIGTEIQLAGIDTNHPNSAEYRDWLAKSRVTLVPIFEIDRIEFGIGLDNQLTTVRLTPLLRVDWGDYPTKEDRETIVQQLVLGYGFEMG